MILIGLLVVVAIAGFAIFRWAVGINNRLVQLNEAIPHAWSQVENMLQRRNDLIPNYVNTVKGFAKQEQTIYNEISQALTSFNRATTIPAKVAADNTLTGLLSRLMTVSLSYPQLQSNENFLRLQDELAGTENRIAVERKRFNDTVLAYNSTVKSFPESIIAQKRGFTPSEAYFKAPDAAKQAPQVQF
jgi:LemA protein